MYNNAETQCIYCGEIVYTIHMDRHIDKDHHEKIASRDCACYECRIIRYQKVILHFSNKLVPHDIAMEAVIGEDF